MPKTSKSKQQQIINIPDLIFTFKNINVACYANGDIQETELNRIKQAVKSICKEICIDKSFVDFNSNKHRDVFMLEKRWNELCQLVIQTNNGKKATKQQKTAMEEAFCLMILCYIYLFLENLEYSTDQVILEIIITNGIHVKYEKDKIQEWKHYPGNWQLWNQD